MDAKLSWAPFSMGFFAGLGTWEREGGVFDRKGDYSKCNLEEKVQSWKFVGVRRIYEKLFSLSLSVDVVWVETKTKYSLEKLTN